MKWFWKRGPSKKELRAQLAEAQVQVAASTSYIHTLEGGAKGATDEHTEIATKLFETENKLAITVRELDQAKHQGVIRQLAEVIRAKPDEIAHPLCGPSSITCPECGSSYPGDDWPQNTEITIVCDCDAQLDVMGDESGFFLSVRIS